MFGWINRLLGRPQACTCDEPRTRDQVHCDVCGYELVERSKTELGGPRGPA